MSERGGVVVRWVIDGQPASMGYFQRWALPVGGDRVMLAGAHPGDPGVEVEVLYRVFTEPERDEPFVAVHARRVVSVPPVGSTADVELLEAICGHVHLYADDRWLTRQMTTEEKERFADAVERWSGRLDPDEPAMVYDRWWR